MRTEESPRCWQLHVDYFICPASCTTRTILHVQIIPQTLSRAIFVVDAIVFSEYILSGSNRSDGPCGIVETITNATNWRPSTVHPRDFSAVDVLYKASANVGSIAVAKRRAEAQNVRLDKCQRDSECCSMLSWLIERTAKMRV